MLINLASVNFLRCILPGAVALTVKRVRQQRSTDYFVHEEVHPRFPLQLEAMI